MTTPLVLAIDQGTTNTKAILVDAEGHIHAQASSPLATHYPQPGWAEQSGDAIWESVQDVIRQIVSVAGAEHIAAVAIANQRETLVSFDAQTGNPIAPAIIWQCRRTAAVCEDLRKSGHDPAVVAATGLNINPLFPASKLGWIMKNVPEAATLSTSGHLRAGTVDSWLLYKLTGGAVFATDHSNASRTQLFNTDTLTWDTTLCDLFEVPLGALPKPLPSDSLFGRTASGVTALPEGIPIHAMMGDSHAALYGHGVRAPGIVKATYGTGSSLMTLTEKRVASKNGLSGTIAWTDRNGTAYALEGNITVSTQAASFMASLVGVADAQALSDLAQTVDTSAGVTFVPALAGLGAPHWRDEATGTISGMTHGTKPAHLARATFEAIALQICDVFAAMEQDIGKTLDGLKADGGGSANPFLMQLQADLLNRPVECGEVAEIGAMGAASMVFAALEMVMKTSANAMRDFRPELPEEMRKSIVSNWKDALSKC